MRYQRNWITAPAVNTMALKKEINDYKIFINIKKREKYNVIDHEKHFFKTKLSSIHKSKHYNPHRKATRY
ncbi:MAG: hypothetical protein KKE12_20885 [Proteobacteria bacterium]|nr:hypothetical protein [Pseudomonadota bacterium]